MVLKIHTFESTIAIQWTDFNNRFLKSIAHKVDAFFYGIWIKQSGAMVSILNSDKVSQKKLFSTMNI